MRGLGKLFCLLLGLGISELYTPINSDSLNDIDDLKNMIKSTGTKIIESNECKFNKLGHYHSSKAKDELVICINNIDKNDLSSYWEILAHESAHVMQACINNNLYKDEYHPRMIRRLKSEAPHYADILNKYRGRNKIRELEAFIMELETPEIVKEDFIYYCMNQSTEENNSENIEITQSQVDDLQSLVGGKKEYIKMMDWARKNISNEEITQYDNLMEKGDISKIKIAIIEMNQKYIKALEGSHDMQLNDSQISELKSILGGDEAYNDLMIWLQDNYSYKQVEEFDQIMLTGNISKMKEAIIKAKRLYEGNILYAERNQIKARNIAKLKSIVGGESEYFILINWIKNNLSYTEYEAYNKLIDGNNYEQMKMKLLEFKNKFDKSFSRSGNKKNVNKEDEKGIGIFFDNIFPKRNIDKSTKGEQSLSQKKNYWPVSWNEFKYPPSKIKRPHVIVRFKASIEEACKAFYSDKKLLKNIEKGSDIDGQFSELLDEKRSKAYKDLWAQKSRLNASAVEVLRQAEFKDWKLYSRYSFSGVGDLLRASKNNNQLVRNYGNPETKAVDICRLID